MSLSRIAISALALSTVSGTAFAEDDWQFRATAYGWLTGLTGTVDTPQGELEAEVGFDEILEDLEIAFFGAIEARKGRWAVVGDVFYSDVTSETPTPFGNLYSRGEIGAETTLLSGYVTYSIVDNAETRFEIGGGVRHNNIDIDTLLVGQNGTPDAVFGRSDDWADLLVAARVTQRLSERWTGTAFADIGGFGIDGSSDLTWQVFGGANYSFNEKWSGLVGYRYQSIERELQNTDITVELYGPVIGVQYTF